MVESRIHSLLVPPSIQIGGGTSITQLTAVNPDQIGALARGIAYVDVGSGMCHAALELAVDELHD